MLKNINWKETMIQYLTVLILIENSSTYSKYIWCHLNPTEPPIYAFLPSGRINTQRVLLINFNDKTSSPEQFK